MAGYISSACGLLRREINRWALGGLLMAGLASLAPASAAPVKVLALGDSLTAGYGLPAEDAFPVKLQAALAGAGVEAAISNGGVSGDTTAGGLARLDWALADHPAYALVELGANDALRGIYPKLAYSNLDMILTKLEKAGVKPMLLGMKAPDNWGPDYVRDFDRIYPDLAAKHHVPLYPFFLDGVVGHAALIQADGLHPTSEGVSIIVGKVLPAMKSFLTAKP